MVFKFTIVPTLLPRFSESPVADGAVSLIHVDMAKNAGSTKTFVCICVETHVASVRLLTTGVESFTR